MTEPDLSARSRWVTTHLSQFVSWGPIPHYFIFLLIIAGCLHEYCTQWSWVHTVTVPWLLKGMKDAVSQRDKGWNSLSGSWCQVPVSVSKVIFVSDFHGHREYLSKCSLFTSLWMLRNWCLGKIHKKWHFHCRTLRATSFK